MNFFYSLSFLTLLFTFSCNAPSEPPAQKMQITKFDEATETAAIMNTIEGETKNFFDGKYEAWAKHWSHSPYALQAWNNSDGSADAAVGWDKINAQGKAWIEKYYQNGKKIIHPDVKREKPVVKFFNDHAAYLMWKQYNADADGKFYRISRETRIMEKDSQGWNIVNVSAFWDTEKKIPADSITRD
ncbi:MAG: hypothetical protein IPN29_09335 [Saprospiraceae bacterium]|nr:hypothetical protein [Saprospiraceae bacterium]